MASVSLSNVSQSGATLNVFGKGAGSTQVLVRDGTSQIVSLSVMVVVGTTTTTMTVSPTSLSVAAGANGSHATQPLTANGGPYGMHTIGTAWVKEHGNYAEASAAQCRYCHGSDYRGSALAQVKVARTYAIDNGRNVNFTAGQKVGCYDCHNGPKP